MTKLSTRASSFASMISPKRAFWFACGMMALGLGAIGAALPVLPTTPFIILAAFAFSKSSPVLENWLLQNETFGPIITKWREEGAIAPRYKLFGIILMLITLGASIVMQLEWWIILLQASLMSIGAFYVLSRPDGRQ